MKCTQESLLCCLAIVAAMPSAVSAETMFDGKMKITAVNNCPQGPAVGQVSNASFHPNAVTGGTQMRNASALNMLRETGAQTWVIENAAFTSAFQQTTTNLAINWTAFVPAKPSFVKITKPNPAVFSATAASVSIAGQIKNFAGQPGQENCIVTFDMVGLLNNR